MEMYQGIDDGRTGNLFVSGLLRLINVLHRNYLNLAGYMYKVNFIPILFIMQQ